MHLIEQNLYRSKYILLPHSGFKVVWDIIQLLIVLYMSITIPLNYSFGLSHISSSIDVVLEMFLIFDIFVQMNCGFQTKGMFILSRSLIMKNYFTTWFITDVISALPVSTFFYIMISDQIHSDKQIMIDYNPLGQVSSVNTIAISVFAKLQFLKIIRVIKISVLQEKINDLIMTDNGDVMFKACKLVITTFLVAHWLGCTFWVIGTSEKIV